MDTDNHTVFSLKFVVHNNIMIIAIFLSYIKKWTLFLNAPL